MGNTQGNRVWAGMTTPAMVIRLGKHGCLVSTGILWLAGLSFGQATISLSPTSGPPTTSTLVSGNGFSPNAAVDISFDTAKEASATTDGSGSFSISIPVPGSAKPGEHQVAAKQPSLGSRAQAQFDANTNWSQFHFSPQTGNFNLVQPDNRVNPYENVLGAGNASGLKLEWGFATSNNVDSSPAVANGVVFVGSDDGNLYALNASTGAKLWSFATGSSVYSSPAIADGVVYVGSDDFNVYALNASTGAKLWSFATGFYVDSSPAVANGVVYVGSWDSNVYALNASTGANLWSFVTNGYVESSPAVANGVVYVASSDSNVYAFGLAGAGPVEKPQP